MEVRYFVDQEISVGEVAEGKSVTVTFKAKDNIPVIEDVVVTCGCTQPKYSAISKELRVTYKAGSIKGVGVTQVNFTKFVEVYYAHGLHKVDKLRIVGTKIKKK